jgi:hypothetical protein
MRSALYTYHESYFHSGFQKYEEVIVPPAIPVPPKVTERLIPISELDPLAKGCFPVSFAVRQVMHALTIQCKGYTSLNRIQSIVYPTAYGSNENMLICGKSVLQSPSILCSHSRFSSHGCCMLTCLSG